MARDGKHLQTRISLMRHDGEASEIQAEPLL